MATAERWRAWRAFAKDPAVDAAIVSLYRELNDRVTQRGPVCWASGRCCNFDAFGHRLYVTTLEIAWVLQNIEGEAVPQVTHAVGGALPILTKLAPANKHDASSCVYQVEGLCSIHRVRPLGCRIFFCQRGTEAWQHDLYEFFLNELRALHERHAIPYCYMEWRAGLREAEHFV